MVRTAQEDAGTDAILRTLAALFFAGVATFAQLYAPQSLLAPIAMDFVVDPAKAALVVSVATVAVGASVVPWAYVAGRIGRVRAMSISVASAAGLGALVPFAPTFEILLACRAMEGAALGAIPAVAMAYLAEEIRAAHSPRAAGAYVAGTTLGGLAGRAIAGPIAEAADWRLGMLVVSAVCAGSALCFIALVPRPATPVPLPETKFGERFRSVLVRPWFLMACVHGFLLAGAFVAMFNYLGFHLEAPPMEVSAAVVSALYFTYLAGTWSSARVGRWVVRHGRRRLLSASLLTMAAGVVLTVPPWLPTIIVGLAAVAAGFFAANALVAGWVPTMAPEAGGEASALYTLSTYLGSSVLGWAVGVVFAAWGWVGAAAALVALVALAALAMVRARLDADPAPLRRELPR